MFLFPAAVNESTFGQTSLFCLVSASHSFPYVKKRILVVYHKEEELSPIEVAIDEMRSRVTELDDVIAQRIPDVKRLQLKLQGSVSAQVCDIINFNHVIPVAPFFFE